MYITHRPMSVSGYDTRFILVSALQFERFIFEGLFPNTLLIKKKSAAVFATDCTVFPQTLHCGVSLSTQTVYFPKPFSFVIYLFSHEAFETPQFSVVSA